MKYFYKKLIEQLTSENAINAFTNKNVRAVSTVDLYRGQYLYEDSFETLILPAVLLEFTIDHLSKEATITLHICYEQLHDTVNTSATIEQSLLFFDFIDVVYSLVRNLESEHTGKLRIISENQQKDDTPTNVHLLTFDCSYTGRTVSKRDKYIYSEMDKVASSGGFINNF